jgi:hypothetical protein
VNQRLATGDRHHWRATFINRLHAFLNAEALIENFVWIINFAAASAGQIATEEGFKHQDERVAFNPAQLVADDVAGDSVLLDKRNTHALKTPGQLAINHCDSKD